MRTKIIKNNGFNPIWNESISFETDDEEVNMILFKVFDDDGTLLCWNAISVDCLLEGIRVVEMKDQELK